MDFTKLNEKEFEFNWKGVAVEDGSCSSITIFGKYDWDENKKKFKAEITQGSRDVVSYDDDSAVAAAKVILKWLL